MKRNESEELTVEMIPYEQDEETIRQILDELSELLYDHMAKLRKDHHLPATIESGSFKERTGS